MERITLGNRPVNQAPRTKIEDFLTPDGHRVRVSIELSERIENPHGQGVRFIVLDAQAFEVDENGSNKTAPNGRPSRTAGEGHPIIASALGDTHTLVPGWVRMVGDYNDASFDASVPRVTSKPTAEPDWVANPEGQAYDTSTGIGYRWDEGETLKIAKAKVGEMVEIIRNSNAIAGIEF